MALTPPGNDRVSRPAIDCLPAELLASYIDGTATPEEQAEIEAHLARCEDCYFVFSETVLEQKQERAVMPGQVPADQWWRRWSPRLMTGLAVAAALLLAVQVFRPGPGAGPGGELQAAVRDLDAASGAYRTFEPRLSLAPTHRDLAPVLRSASASAETPLALRDAAGRVERAAAAEGTATIDAGSRRALAAMYFALGNAAGAADVLAPEAASNEPEVLNDLAAAYLARQRDGDVPQAMDLLERAVRLDPARAEAWFNLGLAAEAAGQSARALAAWNSYLALDSASAWANEARTHLERLQP